MGPVARLPCASLWNPPPGLGGGRLIPAPLTPWTRCLTFPICKMGTMIVSLCLFSQTWAFIWQSLGPAQGVGAPSSKRNLPGACADWCPRRCPASASAGTCPRAPPSLPSALLWEELWAGGRGPPTPAPSNPLQDSKPQASAGRQGSSPRRWGCGLTLRVKNLAHEQQRRVTEPAGPYSLIRSICFLTQVLGPRGREPTGCWLPGTSPWPEQRSR